MGFRQLLPRVSFALFQTREIRRRSSSICRTITSTTSPTLTTLDGWMFLLVQSIRKRLPGLQRLLRFQRSSRSRSGWSRDRPFRTFRITFSDATTDFAQLFSGPGIHGTFAVELQHFTVISSPTLTISLGCLTRFQAMSVICSAVNAARSRIHRSSQVLTIP